MKLQNMFKKTSRLPRAERRKSAPEIPEGLWRKCNKCGAAIIAEDVRSGLYICPHCHGYFRIHAYRRIELLADEGTFEEWDARMEQTNPLNFRGYAEKLEAQKEKTGLDEAVVTGKIRISGIPAVIGVCDGRFMMASMGEAVGEKLTRAIERATAEKLPVIFFTCSGGARMQEGIISLMQMAKTSAALKRHSDAGLLYVTVLTDPTTGGVTASFAMLGDIILAEPRALIGFAGPRVIEQTIGQKLPKGFQRSEFLQEHGFIDRIVEREEMKEVLSEILRMHEKESGGCDGKLLTDPNSISGAAENCAPDACLVSAAEESMSAECTAESGAGKERSCGCASAGIMSGAASGMTQSDEDAAADAVGEEHSGRCASAGIVSGAASGMTQSDGDAAADAVSEEHSGRRASAGIMSGAASGMTQSDEDAAECGVNEERPGRRVSENIVSAETAWERVQLSRKKDRPVGSDYLDSLFPDFMEFHGDRYYGDDQAVIGGIARFHGKPVTVIVQAKGKTTSENIGRNFGMPSPEGYRKALRLMKQAEKFGRPVICFVDTPGAFCGLEAEERGQGEAIATNLFEMSSLKVPVLSIVIGEGGSGGALAMAVADEVWMLQNAVYSILSPEGFASILWKDSKKAAEAARMMKLTADDLKELGVIERIIPEPEEFTVETMGEVQHILEQEMEAFLQKYGSLTAEELTGKRYRRFRSM